MTADDVRLTAQLVVDGRVHCVSDAAVEALARRVLELEADLQQLEGLGVEAVTPQQIQDGERQHCAALADDIERHLRAKGSIAADAARDIATAIRTRGGK